MIRSGNSEEKALAVRYRSAFNRNFPLNHLFRTAAILVCLKRLRDRLGDTEANVIKVMILVTLCVLLRDSAMCSDKGNTADLSPYIRYGIPQKAGEPFWKDGKIGGGIEEKEQQIPYREYEDRDWNNPPLKFLELINEAVRRNPSTHQNWELANMQAATWLAAKGAYWPTVTFEGGAKPTFTRRDDFNNSTTIGETRVLEVDYPPTLAAKYLLLDFGGRQGGIDAVRFNLLASQFAINQALQTVVLQVMKSYYALQQANESVRIADRSFRATSEEVTQIGLDLKETQRRLKELETNPSDSKIMELLKEESSDSQGSKDNQFSAMTQEEKAQAASQMLQYKGTFLTEQLRLALPNNLSFELSQAAAHSAVRTANIQLSASVGLPGDIILNVVPWDKDNPPKRNLANTARQLINLALRSRPDIANKYASYQSAVASARQARSNIYPTLNATFTGSTTEANTKVWKDDLTSSTTHTVGRLDNLSGGVIVSVPVFDGFMLVNKARAARRAAAAAKADLANNELGAIADVAANLEAYNSALEQYEIAGRLQENARQAFETAKISYGEEYPKQVKAYQQSTTDEQRSEPRTKMITLLNSLLNAQTGRDTAEQARLQATLNVFTSSFQLTNSVGALLPIVFVKDKVPSVLDIPVPNSPTKN
ncbi:MAG TPA: TolC family protein [Chthoniobacterales bacterium]|jgi:outer membrane protein TolC|nr:TolC family protein [Chthoniobacterales bacterium]